MVLREKGQARLVYLRGDVGRTHWRSGHPDVGGLIRNTLRADAVEFVIPSVLDYEVAALELA